MHDRAPNKRSPRHRSSKYPRRRLAAPQQLERRICFDATLPFAAVNDFVAVPDSSAANIIRALDNDLVTAGPMGDVRIRAVTAPRHGSAIVDSNSGTIVYSPVAGFEGFDEFTYEIGGASGPGSSATVRIRVGLAAQAPEPIQDLLPTTSAVEAEAWLRQLEEGTGDIVIPEGGITIDRVVTISRAVRLVGNGRTLRITDQGKLIVDLASPQDRFELTGAVVVWDRNFSTEGNDLAIELRRGDFAFTSNEFYALAIPSSDAYAEAEDIEQIPAQGYLIGVGSDYPSPSGLHISNNRFSNVYWYGAGAIRIHAAAPIPAVSIEHNQFEYFHQAVSVSRSPGVLVANNRFEHNTGHNLVVANSPGALVSRNRFDFSGGSIASDTIRLENVTGGRVVENVIVNSGGTAIRLSGDITEIDVSKNFIHAAAGSGLAISSPPKSTLVTVASHVTVAFNTFAQNAGWAIEAKEVTGLELVENVLHQNRREAGFQHKFTNVSVAVDERNLWDEDFIPNDGGQAAMFGINARAYRFNVGEVHDESEQVNTPMDAAAVAAKFPTGSSQAYEVWIQQLLNGSGDIVIPESGIVIDRPITIRNPRRILGEGRTLILKGRGSITIEMTSSEHSFELENATLIWDRDFARDGAANGVTIVKGGLILRDNAVYSLVTPEYLHYDDAKLQENLTRLTIAQTTSRGYFFDIRSPGHMPGKLVVERNTFENARWYATGLLFAAESSRFSTTSIRDNTIKYFHGALYVSGADGGLIEGNRLYRNTFGNLIIRNSTNLVVQFNRVEFPGNGTSGDGATMWGLSNLVFRNNVITNGSCYGIWALDNLINARFEDNVVHAGITSALRLEPISEGLVANITISGNLFSHNNSWGLSGQSVKGLTVIGNIFHNNVSGSFQLQHHFWDVEKVTAENNVRTADPSAAAADPEPYFMLSEGRELRVDGDTWTIHGTARDDLFRVLIEDKVHVQVNGEWRAIAMSPSTRLQIVGEGGTDASVIFLRPESTIALLAPGAATILDPEVQILSDSETHSVYGHEQAVAIFMDSIGNDRLYASPGYVRSNGTGYENYAAGFGGTLAYAGQGTDTAVIDDSPGNDVVLMSDGLSCFIGSAFKHSMAGFSQVTFRSDAGGTDEAVFFTSNPSSVGAIHGGVELRHSRGFNRALRIESFTTETSINAISDLSNAQGCLNYGPLTLPNGTIRGRVVVEPGATVPASAIHGMAGQTVFLDANGNSILDDGELRTTTGGDGSFEFLGLAPGNYSVVHLATAGWAVVDTGQNATVWPNQIAADIRLTSAPIFTVEKGVLIVLGTPGTDHFAFDASASTHKVRVNGIEHSVDLTTIKSVRISGQGGMDSVVLIGSAGNDSLISHPESAEYKIPGLKVNISDIANLVAVDESGGNDLATLFDSAGDDVYEGGSNSGSLVSDDRQVSVSGFERINVYAVNGGADHAVMADSEGDDDFVSTTDFSRLMGEGYYQYLRGFDAIEVDSVHGGSDRAAMYDSALDDVVIAEPTFTRLTTPLVDTVVRRFDRVSVYATAGGFDTATLGDSAGDDEFVGTPTYGRLLGPGFYNYVQGFDRIEVNSSIGGTDRASVYDSASDDVFVGKPGMSRLYGTGFDHKLHGFEFVYAHATSGGRNNASLYDSAGNDELISTPVFSRLMGQGYYIYAQRFAAVDVFATQGGKDAVALYDSAGNDELISKPGEMSSMRGSMFANTVYGFESVYGYATAGGRDKATLYDTPGDDELVSTPTFSRIQGSGFYAYAGQFDEVNVEATRGGLDRAQFHDSSGSDLFEAAPSFARMSGPGYKNEARGIELIYAFANSGGIDTAKLADSSGNDDLIATPNLVRLFGSSYYLYAANFEQNIVTASTGHDVAEIRDIDRTHQLSGHQGEALLDRGPSTLTAVNFDRLVAHGRDGQLANVDVSAVDYLFERVGIWN